MYKLRKTETYLRVNLLGPGPHFMKNEIYRAAVSQRLRNTSINLLFINETLCLPVGCVASIVRQIQRSR